uniref:Uncharacterized protein n=1 Tax=Magallana gigas TaxID=29159 RepID=K1QE33_MAGGI
MRSLQKTQKEVERKKIRPPAMNDNVYNRIAEAKKRLHHFGNLICSGPIIIAAKRGTKDLKVAAGALWWVRLITTFV